MFFTHIAGLPKGDAMYQAWVIITILSAGLLSACAHEPDESVMNQSSWRVLLDTGWYARDEFRIYEDSFGWHQDFFDQRALYRLIIR